MIQDFYSHTNWVEMGNTNLQTKIGTTDFEKEPMVAFSDENLCSEDNKNSSSSCVLLSEECSFWVTLFSTLLEAIGCIKMNLFVIIKFSKYLHFISNLTQ
jgi:hypothetical protein